MPTFPFVVADIGGTNGRFAVVTGEDTEQGYQFEQVQIYSSSESKNLVELVQRYLKQLPTDLKISGACLAFAGPVMGDRIKSTNLNWDFSITEVKEALGLQSFFILNDFAAFAYSMPHIPRSFLKVLQDGVKNENAPMAGIGPGTGFGVAGLVPSSNKTWTVLGTEGGHIGLAATSAFEDKVCAALRKEHGYTSVEQSLCGTGLPKLYKAICQVQGVKAQDYVASDIAQRGINKEDDTCHLTMKTFCRLIGSSAGNYALTLGALGGLYIGGGILRRFPDFLLENGFMEAFLDKGPLEHYVKQVPINLIVDGEPALIGSAAWYIDQTK